MVTCLLLYYSLLPGIDPELYRDRSAFVGHPVTKLHAYAVYKVLCSVQRNMSFFVNSLSS